MNITDQSARITSAETKSNQCLEFPVGGDYQAVKSWYDNWFDSDDGELVKPAYSTDGYSFSDIRRTVDENGRVRTRYTLTEPNGTTSRIIGLGSGCHSPIGGAEFGDDCGCDKCEAYMKSKN